MAWTWKTCLAGLSTTSGLLMTLTYDGRLERLSGKSRSSISGAKRSRRGGPETANITSMRYGEHFIDITIRDNPPFSPCQ